MENIPNRSFFIDFQPPKLECTVLFGNQEIMWVSRGKLVKKRFCFRRILLLNTVKSFSFKIKRTRNCHNNSKIQYSNIRLIWPDTTSPSNYNQNIKQEFLLSNSLLNFVKISQLSKRLNFASLSECHLIYSRYLETGQVFP